MTADAGAALKDTAQRIESLGRNCEFGYVQRALQVEQLGLLRWAGVPMPGLIDALRNGFAGLAERMTGRPDPPNRQPEKQEWWLTCCRYDILFHSGQSAGNTTVEQATANVRKRLRWLADKLLGDLRAGEKVFVYSSIEFAGPRDGLPVAEAVRQAGGTAPILLVASGADEPVAPIGANVWGARLARLTRTGEAASIQLDPWLRLLRECRTAIPALRPGG